MDASSLGALTLNGGGFHEDGFLDTAPDSTTLSWPLGRCLEPGASIVSKASSRDARGTCTRRHALWVPLALVVNGCREPDSAVATGAPGETAVRRDVQYVPGSQHRRHRLDIYSPALAADRRPAAFVHFVHGGYWVSGNKDGDGHGPRLYGSIGRALAARGIGCIIQSYRLAPEVGIEGMIADVQAAVAWSSAHVHEHDGDPDRMFMMGHSAGGHLVALLAADPARRPTGVRGYLPLSAIWDVADMHATQSASFNRNVTYPVFGSDEASHRRYSPLSYLSRDTPPIFIAVAANDFPYMIPQADRARARLADLGRAPTFVRVPGNSHMDMVVRFGAPNDNMSDLVVRYVARRTP